MLWPAPPPPDLLSQIYSNVTNVMARLSSRKSSIKSAVLVNAHFDSVPGSPGAADDGVGIAVMLEIIRTLSSTSTALDKPIVFLFNGAEEWVHHGAHGFITQHPWAREVDYLINLEAIGSGGREMVFQCNSGQVAEIYGKVAPYPLASVLAHELFKHFLYKVASTDWATFIKYGKSLHNRDVRGVDTAYVDNGYVYHTSFDKQEAVPGKITRCSSAHVACSPLPSSSTDGTLLNTGENILHLVTAMASSTSNAPEGDQDAVFFDYFGFLIRYSAASVVHLHTAVVIFGLITLIYILHATRHTWEDLWVSVCLEAGTVFYTILVGGAIGLCAYAFFPMRWYDGGVLVSILIFIPPLMLFMVHRRAQHAEQYLKHTKVLRQLAVLVLWLVQVIPCIYFNVKTAYLGCLWIASICVSTWIYYLLHEFHLKGVLQGKGMQFCAPEMFSSFAGRDSSLYTAAYNHLYLLSLFPVMLIWMKTINATLVMIVPLFGKSGTVVPSDIALGAVYAVHIALPMGTFLANNLNKALSRNTVRINVALLGLLFAYLIVFRSSYSAAHPKRLWIQRIERHYRSIDLRHPRYLPGHIGDMSLTDGENILTDKGLWVSGFDERGLEPIMPAIYDFYDGVVGDSSGSVHRYMESIYRSYLTPNSLHYERNGDCNMFNGDCFFAFPWYFPVPDALRHGLYLPLHGTAGDDPFNGPVDDKMRLGLRSHRLDQRALPPLPCLERGTFRLVEVDLHGPSHVNLALRDVSGGQRIVAWWLDDLSVITNHADKVPGFVREDVLNKLTCSAAPRSEGIHYFHVGTGRCDAHPTHPLLCTHRRAFFLVDGQEAVEVVAYGHFVDLVKDPYVTGFIDSLPSWSKGAEWTKFPSVLISDVI